MPMVPKCINCKHHKQEYVPVGGQKVAKVMLCEHPDFGDPVVGSSMSCADVRKIEEYCGFTGKGFEQEEPKKDGPKIATI